MNMRMVNSLAAAEPVVLLHSDARCSQSFLLRDRRFLHRRHQVTHLVRLKVEDIARAQSFRDHQHVTRRAHLFLRQRHEDEHAIVLEYLGPGRLRALIADQLRNPILRIVFALEPGISPRRRQFGRRDLRHRWRHLREQKREQGEKCDDRFHTGLL